VTLNSSYPTALTIAALMLAACVGANVSWPTLRLTDERPAVSLERMIPAYFGNWREDRSRSVHVVNPQTQALLDKLYSQLVTRVYVNKDGDRIMLSIAYGTDQRERSSLQAHKPEVCYPAQGFVLHKNVPGMLATAFGTIPVRRLFATLGVRQEHVTYWFTVGDTAVRSKLHKRLLDLRYGLTGHLPDGILFRVSSIDQQQARAHQLQDQFVNQLLESVSFADRVRLSGLGGS